MAESSLKRQLILQSIESLVERLQAVYLATNNPTGSRLLDSIEFAVKAAVNNDTLVELLSLLEQEEESYAAS